MYDIYTAAIQLLSSYMQLVLVLAPVLQGLFYALPSIRFMLENYIPLLPGQCCSGIFTAGK